MKTSGAPRALFINVPGSGLRWRVQAQTLRRTGCWRTIISAVADVERLLADPRFAESSARIGRTFREAGGVELAADAIERLLEGKRNGTDQ